LYPFLTVKENLHIKNRQYHDLALPEWEYHMFPVRQVPNFFIGEETMTATTATTEPTMTWNYIPEQNGFVLRPTPELLRQLGVDNVRLIYSRPSAGGWFIFQGEFDLGKGKRFYLLKMQEKAHVGSTMPFSGVGSPGHKYETGAEEQAGIQLALKFARTLPENALTLLTGYEPHPDRTPAWLEQRWLDAISFIEHPTQW
jgi:hypothetical protein